MCSRRERLFSYKALEISPVQAEEFYTVLAGVFGIDFTNYTALEVYNQWYNLTKYREVASFTHRQELTLISVILNRYFSESPFQNHESHINCNDPLTNEFSYSKIEVQPNWPN